MFKKKNHKINILKLSGVISGSGKKNISFDNSKEKIDKLFKTKAPVVGLIINSPGGSAVQSEMIANYIIKKSKETKIKVITFVEEVAASGGYWLALSGEQIYALSKSSIVGSLGVVYASFGFEDFIKKHDIKRRVHTAGKNKVSMDIFQEEKAEDIQRLHNMLAEIHKHFKDWVLSQRESKITLDHDNLFSGEFWLSSIGLQHGLIDGICIGVEDKLKEIYGNKVKFNYIITKKPILGFLPFVKMQNFESIVDEVVVKAKSESLWNKFGL